MPSHCTRSHANNHIFAHENRPTSLALLPSRVSALTSTSTWSISPAHRSLFNLYSLAFMCKRKRWKSWDSPRTARHCDCPCHLLGSHDKAAVCRPSPCQLNCCLGLPTPTGPNPFCALPLWTGQKSSQWKPLVFLGQSRAAWMAYGWFPACLLGTGHAEGREEKAWSQHADLQPSSAAWVSQKACGQFIPEII